MTYIIVFIQWNLTEGTCWFPQLQHTGYLNINYSHDRFFNLNMGVVGDKFNNKVYNTEEENSSILTEFIELLYLEPVFCLLEVYKTDMLHQWFTTRVGWNS